MINMWIYIYIYHYMELYSFNHSNFKRGKTKIV